MRVSGRDSYRVIEMNEPEKELDCSTISFLDLKNVGCAGERRPCSGRTDAIAMGMHPRGKGHLPSVGKDDSERSRVLENA